MKSEDKNRVLYINSKLNIKVEERIFHYEITHAMQM